MGEQFPIRIQSINVTLSNSSISSVATITATHYTTKTSIRQGNFSINFNTNLMPQNSSENVAESEFPANDWFLCMICGKNVKRIIAT
jgi:hypothetical protein